ncbi:MAG: hypothetical protein KAX49_11780 [Halanaerobiales bacterium]|nr:hypothetical protein [Halanaerobiales bacterium]
MRYNIFYYIPKGFYRRTAGSDHKQIPVFDSKEIESKLYEKDEVYASVCLFKGEKTFPTHFFLDFDCEKDLAKQETDKLKEYCKRNLLSYSIAEPRRGYHFYIHITPLEMSGNVFSFLSDYIISNAGIEHYDDQVDGVITGIARLPGSYYPKLKRRVRLMEQEMFPLKNPFLLLDDNVRIPDFKLDNNGNNNNGGSYRPCIDYFIQDSHPSQFIRFAWCVLRIAQKKSDNEIMKEAKSYNWNDWNPDYTSYQIRQIRNKNYVVPTCGSVRKVGYCTAELCKWRKHIRK